MPRPISSGAVLFLPGFLLAPPSPVLDSVTLARRDTLSEGFDRPVIERSHTNVDDIPMFVRRIYPPSPVPPANPSPLVEFPFDDPPRAYALIPMRTRVLHAGSSATAYQPDTVIAMIVVDLALLVVKPLPSISRKQNLPKYFPLANPCRSSTYVA